MLGKPWDFLVSGCVHDDVATIFCLPAVFQNVVTAALSFATVVTVFMIIYAGIKYIISGGDQKQVEGARQTLTYAIIGLIIIFLSFLIINLIATVTGANCINMFGFAIYRPCK